MPRFTLTKEPSGVQAHTLTNKELLNHVEHVFPTPGPVLAALIQRFETLVFHRHVELEQGDGEHEVEGACPACGTQLEVVASI